MTALLIAMQIVLRRILSFNTLMNSVGFGFVPIVISAMCYGPVNSVIVYSIADIIGSILWPTGPYFPGFTLTAAISGLIYGLLLYKKPQKTSTAILLSFVASLLVALIATLGLNLFWLCNFFDLSLAALLPSRISQAAVNIPVHTVITSLMWLKLYPMLEKTVLRNRISA